jgi:hypothetical protein
MTAAEFKAKWKLGRRESGETLSAFERTESARVRFWEIPLTKAALFLLLAALTLSAHAGVREVGAIGMTVGDLDRELMFYTNTLPFELFRTGDQVHPAPLRLAEPSTTCMAYMGMNRRLQRTNWAR